MKKKILLASIIALSLALLVAVGGTIAYLFTDTQDVVNTFTYGDINITLQEEASDIDDGDNNANTNEYMGTFYPPHRLFIYPGFQKTLKELDRYSGYGEIVKFLLMDGFEKGSVSHVPGRMKDIVGSDGDLAGAVADCLRIKCAFMEDDEFDMGRRNLLNYGHCFGHALEAASGYFVPHGIAVNIGIIFANIVAVMRGRISQEFNDMIREEICLPFIFQEQRDIDYNGEKLLESLKNDKKRTGSGLPVVIPCDGGLEKIADLTFEEFYIALDILKKVLFP